MKRSRETLPLLREILKGVMEEMIEVEVGEMVEAFFARGHSTSSNNGILMVL
jgi:hypothetical protein